MIRKLLPLFFTYVSLHGQYDYSLIDINPSSESYGDTVGTSFFENKVTIHYFGAFTWGTCTARFGQLNDIYNNLKAQNLPVELVGIGKDYQNPANWLNGNNAPICADENPYPIWNNWNAAQRDLFLLDQQGNLVFKQNITSGLPEDFNNSILNLINLRTMEGGLPSNYRLHEAFPNPFNPQTNLSYELPIGTIVSLNIFDITGKMVKNLVNSYQNPGKNLVLWDGTDSKGRKVHSGVYFYMINADKFNQVKKVTLIKWSLT